MSLPIWLMDIDGVLVPFAQRQRGVTYEAVPVGGYHGSVLVVREVLTRVRALHRAGVVQVQWLTAWEDEAASMFAPSVDLDDYAVHTDPGAGIGWWKTRAARTLLETSDRRVVWTDDEFDEWPETRDLAAEFGDRLLRYPVDGMVGLSPSDLHDIEAFLAPTGVSTA